MRTDKTTESEVLDPENPDSEKPDLKTADRETADLETEDLETSNLEAPGAEKIKPRKLEPKADADGISTKGATSGDPLFWVGIGASAGGLEALRAFARNLPGDINATYIVAQHLSPLHRSMLPEIIGRETDIEVLNVEDNVEAQPNKIYITPQNRDIEIEGNRLKLVPPSRDAASPKPSVNRLLKSLATQKKGHAIGIILSGTGSDGAQGMREVRAHGGVTIAQDELTAKYAGMPVAAAETGCVDLIMSPEEIGAQFATILERRRDLSSLMSSPVHLDGVSELIHLVHNQTRVNFRHYKSATLQRRIERRMAAIGVTDVDDYVAIARNSSAEINALFQDFLISVTSFFRDPAEFESLRFFVKQIIERKTENEPIRIWVPGAATGEEPYSLLMLFADELGGADQLAKHRVQLFASDIDRNAIEIARRGFYPEISLEEIPRSFIDEYFEKVPTGYVVKKQLRERMVCSNHNVIQDPPFLNIDMVTCRNLLIYFQNNLQGQVLARLHYALVPNGVLFLGKSETAAAAESLFRPADEERHIFLRRPGKGRAEFNPMAQIGVSDLPAPRDKKNEFNQADLLAAHARFDSLVAAIGPDAFLVGGDLQLKQAYGNVNPYINVASGSLSLGIAGLIREPIAQDICTAVPIVVRKREVRRGIAHVDPTMENRRIRVSVYPIDTGGDNEVLALAVINTWEETPGVTEVIATDDNAELIRQNDELRRELAIAQTNLQQTSEELETSNEELQALNEELQSSNEELQSTNEELETSNEELQSTNEELSTVNEELQVNGQELRVVNQSLKSILKNIGSPLLVVDNNLNIIHISDASEEMFRIKATDELPHLSLLRRQPGMPDMVELVQQSIAERQNIEREISEDGLAATVSIVPNVLGGPQDHGAIILFSDNTDALRRARNELQLIFDNIPLGIFVRNREGKVIKANPAGARLVKRGGQNLEGRYFTELFDQGTRERIERQDQQLLDDGKPIINAVSQFTYSNGEQAWVRVSRILAEDPSSGEQSLYALAQDITAEYEADLMLQTSEQRLDLAVQAAEIGLWDWDPNAETLWWSDKFKQIVGVTDADFKGELDDFVGRLHPEDVDRIGTALDRHLKKHTPYDVRYRMQHTGGHYVWIEARGQASWDENGKPERMIGTVVDVTERLASEIESEQSRSQLEQAAQLSQIGHWRIDLVENTLFWSDRIFEIHGVSPDSYQPDLDTAVKFYHPDDFGRVESLLNKAIEEISGFEFEARLVRASGDERIVRAIGRVLADESGRATSVFGVFQDVTDDRQRVDDLRKTLRELEKSNEELNRFSYVCSHDLKEPVRLIETMSNMLLDPEISENTKQRTDLTERIGSNSARLGRIIDGLLAYSRIDERVEETEVDLDVVLKEITEGLALTIEETGASIKVQPLPTVTGARVHFHQLFQNLIANAIKYNDKDKPKIKISGAQRKDSWQLIVEDNGPGISPENRSVVFDVFRRLNRRDEVDGVGLGLSICDRIVRQYEGNIEISDSRAMGGAKFIVTLPVSEA